MSDTTDTDHARRGAGPAARPRTDEGRWLGGVSAGLGRYFDINPLVYRVAFAALALAGGTGILLYLAAWLVIPHERARSRSRSRRCAGGATSRGSSSASGCSRSAACSRSPRPILARDGQRVARRDARRRRARLVAGRNRERQRGETRRRRRTGAGRRR